MTTPDPVLTRSLFDADGTPDQDRHKWTRDRTSGHPTADAARDYPHITDEPDYPILRTPMSCKPGLTRSRMAPWAVVPRNLDSVETVELAVAENEHSVNKTNALHDATRPTPG